MRVFQSQTAWTFGFHPPPFGFSSDSPVLSHNDAQGDPLLPNTVQTFCSSTNW